MNLFSLSLASIRTRWLTSVLLVILLALGVTTISLLVHFSHHVEQRIGKDASGVDLVVGAKGSPLQLILSTLYHMDMPTGNMPLREAEKIERDPRVKQAIPLALGDNYRNYRIVGTRPAYIAHYNATFAEGRVFTRPLEAVIGAEVALKEGLKAGDEFAGSHGLVASPDVHTEFHYTVVGVLNPTGSVIDRVILTPIESVWEIHDHGYHPTKKQRAPASSHHEEIESAQTHARQEITALLVTYRTRIAAMTMPRQINSATPMQAASPALEMARLTNLIGVGVDTLRFFAYILIGSAVIGMLVAISQSMKDRVYDFSIMRVLGASRLTLMALVLLETGTLLFIGLAFGLAISHGMMAALPSFMAELEGLGMSAQRLLTDEVISIAAIFIAGLFTALIPAVSVYRIDVSRTLAHG